jgi:hypothetical protein
MKFMQVNSVVEHVCQLPVDFYDGSKSMVQLVSESQIDAFPAALTVDVISKYLTDHPTVVEYWLRWSANKRVSSGWYFCQLSDSYVVGVRPGGEVLNISQRELACAEFVVREVRALMAVTRKKSGSD